ncbi:MAG: redoxin domain-containing protein, partial [Halieaceae bacterium]
MKRILIIASVAVLTAVALIYPFRDEFKEAAYDKITENMFVPADNDDFDPGPALGSLFPGVRATWQGRELKLLNELSGPNGTVFLATRSAEWCPYCMKQMIQLQEQKSGFDEAGIGIVAMTYDAPELQQAFVDRHGIEYPLLHDVDTLSFTTLGILNEEYSPGDNAYGIPHPGMIVIDPDGVVVGKLFLEAYSVRVESA